VYSGTVAVTRARGYARGASEWRAMDFAGAIAFAADGLGRAADSLWTYVALGALVAFFAATHLLGEEGERLRGAIIKLLVFVVIGGIGTFGVTWVKGVPASSARVAEPAKKNPEQTLDAWIDRVHRRADAAPAHPRAAGPTDAAHEVSTLRRDLAAARIEHRRAREALAKVPKAARTPDHARRDAAALRGIGAIDFDEGRLGEAVDRYREAQAALSRFTDSESRRAAVSATLGTAEALALRNEERAARAAFRDAIARQRQMPGATEGERRDGVAGALVRYARFETFRRYEAPARAALDEAGRHYEALRARRGQRDVLRARVDLGIAVGDFETARLAVAALRSLAGDTAMPDADAMADADLAHGRLEFSLGRAETALGLFARAVAAYRQAEAGLENRPALAKALLAHAEAAFALREIETARGSATAAIAIRRSLGDRAAAINALAHLALWEATAGDRNAGRKALSAALTLHRETGESRLAANTEVVVQILCAGMMPESEACKSRAISDASASGP